MNDGRSLRIGGYISGGVLIVLGVAVIALGGWGFTFTETTSREGISFGPIETRRSPNTLRIGPASRWIRAVRRSHRRRSCASTRSRAPAD